MPILPHRSALSVLVLLIVAHRLYARRECGVPAWVCCLGFPGPSNRSVPVSPRIIRPRHDFPPPSFLHLQTPFSFPSSAPIFSFLTPQHTASTEDIYIYIKEQRIVSPSGLSSSISISAPLPGHGPRVVRLSVSLLPEKKKHSTVLR